MDSPEKGKKKPPEQVKASIMDTLTTLPPEALLVIEVRYRTCMAH